MITASCTFDPVTHEYTINGHRVPSVTEVLRDLFPRFRASDWYLQRGRAVHACAALVARGVPFEHDPRIAGQVEAVKRFFSEVKPEPIAIEEPIYSEKYHYAGTPDLVARIDGRRVVVDYKSHQDPCTVYQCAAYALARGDVTYGCCVALYEDGTYAISQLWNLRPYMQEWLALLTTYRVRERLGYVTKKEEGNGTYGKP